MTAPLWMQRHTTMLVVVLFRATGWLTEPQSLIPPGPHNTMQAMQNALQTLVGPYAKLSAVGKLIPMQSSQAMDTMDSNTRKKLPKP